MRENSIILLLLASWLPMVALQSPPGSDCKAVLDVIFAVDGSNSMGGENFHRELESLEKLLVELQISPGGIHAGLVFFSKSVAASLPLNGDLQELIREVNAVVYPDQNTRTDLAIDEAVKMFRTGGRRGDVPKILMIITDGASDSRSLTVQAANRAKEEGIKIFAVGVTDQVDETELRQIASQPDKLFLTATFQSLRQELALATYSACATVECSNARIDLVFVLDSSSSVNYYDFELQKTFVKDFLLNLDMNKDTLRVGLLTFADNSSIQFQLNSHVGNRDSLLQAIQTTKYQPGVSNVASALRTLNKMFTGRYGERPDATNVAIFLMGSNSMNGATQTSREAELVRGNGIHIIGVGINLLNSYELDMIVSKPTTSNAFHVSTYTQLSTITQDVYNHFAEFCVGDVPHPPACPLGNIRLSLVVDVSETASQLSQQSYRGDFGHLKSGLKRMLSLLQDPSAPNPQVKVNLITYSNQVASLTDYNTPESVNAAVRAVEGIPGNVRASNSLLSSALMSVSTSSIVYRDTYLAIIAPENAFNIPSIRAQIKQLINRGFRIVPFVVQSDHSLDQQSLSRLVQDPTLSGSRMYYLNSYQDLGGVLQEFVTDEICHKKVIVDDGLCSPVQHQTEGMALVSHPSSCDKFLQCYFNSGKNLHLAVSRQCPTGLFWSSSTQSCTRSDLANCPQDRCRQSSCRSYPAENSCSAYWQCQNGVSVAKCCPKMQSFVEGKGCVSNPVCNETCPVKTESSCAAICLKQPDWGDATKYMDVPSVSETRMSMWKHKLCLLQKFDLVKCQCVPKWGERCPPYMTYDFHHEGIVQDLQQNRMSGIQASGITSVGTGVHLGPTSTMFIKHETDQFSEFTIKVAFRKDTAYDVAGEILLTSGINCNAKTRLAIWLDSESVRAVLEVPSGQSFTLSVPQKGISHQDSREVIFVSRRTRAELVIVGPHYQYMDSVAADLRNATYSCGLNLGEGYNRNSFKGEIEMISLHDCSSTLLY